MIDINFYRKTYALNKALLEGKVYSKEEVLKVYNEAFSSNPVVYNIETTNACNMKCEMCPRTTRMTRSISSLEKEQFASIVDQLRPWSDEEWQKWTGFVTETYDIKPDEMSENHFFLYIIPKVIQLHGYGDPLLDKNLHEDIKILSDKGFYSYFSCNPANIDIERTRLMLENGLDVIKYSIETTDDDLHKKIRGKASNFTKAYNDIMEVMELKKENNYKTQIVITMLDLNRTCQQEDYDKLKDAFEGKDVYIYLKSEDQQWYRKDYHPTKSVHWSEICKHPWMSMTIKSDGDVAMCMEDFNNDVVLGNIKEGSLEEIWNGKKYKQFREDHLNNQTCIKCNEECDMKMVGSCK